MTATNGHWVWTLLCLAHHNPRAGEHPVSSCHEVWLRRIQSSVGTAVLVPGCDILPMEGPRWRLGVVPRWQGLCGWPSSAQDATWGCGRGGGPGAMGSLGRHTDLGSSSLGTHCHGLSTSTCAENSYK